MLSRGEQRALLSPIAKTSSKILWVENGTRKPIISDQFNDYVNALLM